MRVGAWGKRRKVRRQRRSRLAEERGKKKRASKLRVPWQASKPPREGTWALGASTTAGCDAPAEQTPHSLGHGAALEGISQMAEQELRNAVPKRGLPQGRIVAQVPEAQQIHERLQAWVAGAGCQARQRGLNPGQILGSGLWQTQTAHISGGHLELSESFLLPQVSRDVPERLGLTPELFNEPPHAVKSPPSEKGQRHRTAFSRAKRPHEQPPDVLLKILRDL